MGHTAPPSPFSSSWVSLPSVVPRGAIPSSAAQEAFKHGNALPNVCDISIVMLDEFGDETTVSRHGGKLLVNCNGVLKNSASKKKITTEGQKAGKWIIPINTSSSNWNEHKGMFLKYDNFVFCKCKAGRSHGVAAPQPILCDPVATTKCAKTICVVDPETRNNICKLPTESICAATNNPRKPAIKNPSFLCGNGSEPRRECNSLYDIEAGQKWPQVEVEQKGTNCSSKFNFKQYPNVPKVQLLQNW